ncbi:FAD dependent oxidoreductase [Prosthecobacter fusiformis]|uniref:FAD dependent oxidoreductase n=1 Tax=Prosthecobacter fusiformis TaxID=48464 RepID=A0A4R7SU46_9BACT|nr:FAD-dependent oxidoreductase [Prosthecobacter fusiformis]TDU81808.1 FAD dependent oxidoreductase [Prosthecobacter fusiformis]
MLRFLILSLLTLSASAADVIIYGGTPGGIAAAISAARQGRTVTLVEPHNHIGGMTTSGLGKSDIENRAMIGGIFKEFITGVYDHYLTTYGKDHESTKLCNEGYYAEPSVAEKVFLTMLAKEARITVLKGWRLRTVKVEDNRLTSIEIVNHQASIVHNLVAQVFVDATYEGDLYAAAGARFRLGRESRQEFDEPHAGVVYFDYQTHEFLPGSTGAADDRLPAYTYRLCLTKDPANALPMTAPPPGYDRTAYLGYFDDLKAGRLAGPKVFKPGRGYNPAHFNTLVRSLSVTDIPNNKTDVNINPRPLGFPFPEENKGYIKGDNATRQRICEKHRSLTLGLLWFLQNDPEVPEAHRKIANELHLPKDEFTDNAGFPWQLYVREGRRLMGEYTLTQHDITGKGQQPKHHADSIAVGEFPIDSFPASKRQPGDTIVLEGYLGMLDYITRPYEIPYRIMIPEIVDGLIVPVAASTTHVAFSSIRMEPTWMALGQAAGIAAHLSIHHKLPPRKVPLPELQELLLKQGQVLRHVTK